MNFVRIMVYDENIKTNGSKIYYIIGVIILVVILFLYIFSFGAVVLTEQKCKELLSSYVPEIVDAQLVYSENRATFTTDNSNITFYFDGDSAKCSAIISNSAFKKGEICEHVSGDNIYSYAEEFDDFYAIEITYEDITTVQFFTKNENTKLQFDPVKNKVFCKGVSE